MSSQKLPSAFRSIRCCVISVLVDGPAVRRQPHQLVFAAVDLEPAVVGEGRVEQPERVRKLHLLRQLDRVAAADADRGRRPLADAVERQDGGLVERAREERAGGMALVVIREDDRRLDACAQALPDDRGQMQLLLQPDRHRHAEALEARRREREVGLEQPLELAQRLFVERDVVEIAG